MGEILSIKRRGCLKKLCFFFNVYVSADVCSGAHRSQWRGGGALNTTSLELQACVCVCVCVELPDMGVGTQI